MVNDRIHVYKQLLSTAVLVGVSRSDFNGKTMRIPIARLAGLLMRGVIRTSDKVKGVLNDRPFKTVAACSVAWMGCKRDDMFPICLQSTRTRRTSPGIRKVYAV